MSRELEELLRDARAALPSPGARATMVAREAVVGKALARRVGRLRAAAAIVVLLLATAVGIGAGLWIAPPGASSAPVVAGLGFLPAKGWTVVQSAPDFPNASIAVAANVPIATEDLPLEGRPYTTIRSLPPEGLVILAEFAARGDAAVDRAYPAHDGVPRIDEAYRETRWTDQVRPEDPLGQYRLAFAVSGYNVDVRIYAGRLRPTREQLAVAQDQLDRLVVAGEPVTLQASPLIAGWGMPITLSGSVVAGRADENVDIEERACGSTIGWRKVAGAHTEPGGGWRMDWGIGITVSLRATWRGNTSNVVTVRARPGVIIRQKTTTRFGIDVVALKRLDGRRAVLERFDRSRGRFVAVRRFRLAQSTVAGVAIWHSTAVAARVPAGSLVRAVLPRAAAAPCYLAGYSNQLRTR